VFFEQKVFVVLTWSFKD